jgi:ADP-ribosylglycohydrolase
MKISIWQQFASNHSGRYTVVGKFETPEAAQQATETLLALLTQLEAEYETVPSGKRFTPDGGIATLPGEYAVKERYGIDPQTHSFFNDMDQHVIQWDWLIFVKSGETYNDPEPYYTLIARLGGDAAIRWFISHEDTTTICTHLSCTCPDPEIALDILDELYCYHPNQRALEDNPRYGAVVYQHDVDFETLRLDFVADLFNITGQLPTLIQYLEEQGCSDITYSMTELPEVSRDRAIAAYRDNLDKTLDRLNRAREALKGLSVGDALGSLLTTFSSEEIDRCLTRRRLPKTAWPTGLHTPIALATYAVLRDGGAVDKHELIQALEQQGVPMTTEAEQNGRRLPQTASLVCGLVVGAYFADDIDTAVEHARRAAAAIDTNPEASAGAIAMAVTAVWVRRMNGDPDIIRKELLDLVLPFVPASLTREKLMEARNLPDQMAAHDAASVLGNGSQDTAQDTVPLVLWCAGDSFYYYREPIWLAVAARGNYRMLCALVGGIMVMCSGADTIPWSWRQACEPLPEWARTA